jgi:hypothetical protein
MVMARNISDSEIAISCAVLAAKRTRKHNQYPHSKRSSNYELAIMRKEIPFLKDAAEVSE